MNILQVSQFEISGGAAWTAQMVRRHLNSLAVNNTMLVGLKETDDIQVFEAPVDKIKKRLSFLLGRDDVVWSKNYLVGKDFYNNADIVHFYNIFGRFLDFDVVAQIFREKKVIWTLPDEWAFSGNCSFTFENNNPVNGFFDSPSMAEIISKTLYGRSLNKRSIYVITRELFKKAIISKSELYNQKRRMYRDFNGVLIAPSKWMADRISKSVLAGKDLRLIYSGINGEKFKPGNKLLSRNILNLPPDKKIFLYVADGGKDSFYKGWNYCLSSIVALKNDPSVLFLCAGNDLDHIEKRDNVWYIGRIANEQINDYYAAADFFLYPSLADNFPLVVLEAMASGLPVISFRTGGIPEMIEHLKLGYIANYADSSSLLEGVKWALSLDEGLLKKIAILSRLKFDNNFSESIMLKNYFKLYQEIVNK